MSLEDFKRKIVEKDLYEIVNYYLYTKKIHAISEEHKYQEYTNNILSDYSKADHIAIMGSANWCYSLNPRKDFRAFNKISDIDVAIISSKYFHEIWEEIRKYHRKNYYLMNEESKQRIKRNGENIYSGFVSPKWILDKKSEIKINYQVILNKYSDIIVGYKPVNMMFFKNVEETVDYYCRGFRIAKGRI